MMAMPSHRQHERAPHARRRGRRDRGSALIVTTLVLFMLMVAAVTLAGTNAIRSGGALHSRQRVVLLAAADAGIGFKMREIEEEEGSTDSLGTRTYTLDGLTVVVTATDIGSDGVDNDGSNGMDGADINERGVLRLVSVATDPRVPPGQPALRRGVEAFLRAEAHPLFQKGVYVGNREMVSGYKLVVGPVNAAIKTGSPNAVEHTGANATADQETFEEGANDYGDFVQGEVYVNGNLEIRGTTNVYGDIDVTGTANGRPVTGNTTEGVTNVVPPDLATMDYAALADYTLNPTGTSANTAVDFIHEDRWSTADSPYFSNHAGDFDNRNFQFGKSGMNSGPTTYYTLTMNQVDGSGDTLVYVKGNLWLETNNGAGFKIPSSTNGKKVTIVVEGNLYISDELSYNNATKDAVLFIVKGKNDDPSTGGVREDESFVDGYNANGTRSASGPNGVYDVGEMIINDNGDGTYTGPKEGQGNIYFGDRSQIWGGITDGFMYAQNNAYLVTSNTESQVFGVRGFFSAGGVLDMGSTNTNRGQNSDFTNYRVKYDNRIENGMHMKGIPSAQGGGFAGLVVGSWRELAPSEF